MRCDGKTCNSKRSFPGPLVQAPGVICCRTKRLVTNGPLRDQPRALACGYRYRTRAAESGEVSTCIEEYVKKREDVLSSDNVHSQVGNEISHPFVCGELRGALSARTPDSCLACLHLSSNHRGRRDIAHWQPFLRTMATSKLQSKRGDGSKQPNVVDEDDGAPRTGVHRASDDDVPRSGASKEHLGVRWRWSRTSSWTRGFRFTW